MSHIKLSVLSVCAGVLAFVCLGYWYEWSARPLTAKQIDTYLNTIEAQDQVPGGRHDMPALRRFLESDDGKPVYTVNLYRFHSHARYPAGSPYGGTGEEAYDRFSKVMIGLMLERGSHPVYGSTWADPSSDWDRVVVVRYRSRRDLVDLFATEDFADASLHKWASIREHQRMVVQATHIPDGRYVFAIIAALLSGLAFLVGGRLIRAMPKSKRA